jgi:hypothetical protein
MHFGCKASFGLHDLIQIMMIGLAIRVKIDLSDHEAEF